MATLCARQQINAPQRGAQALVPHIGAAPQSENGISRRCSAAAVGATRKWEVLATSCGTSTAHAPAREEGACHCGVVGRRCCCRCCSTVRVLCFFGLCYMMWRCHTHMPHLPHTLLNAPLSECRVQWPRGKVPSNSRKQVNRASSSQAGQTRVRPPSHPLPSSTASCPSDWEQGDE